MKILGTRLGTPALAPFLVAALLPVTFVATGCDDSPDPIDSGTPTTDGGGGVDTGVTLMDSGTPVDTGVPEVDSGTPGMCGPAGGVCQVADAASCGAGMACVLQGGGGTAWTTVCITSGVVAAGGACDRTMQGQCQEGFQCSGPGSDAAGTCTKICCARADCAAGDFCQLIAGAEAGFCQTPDSCDLVAQTGCDGTEACLLAGSPGEVQCTAAGTTEANAECMFLNECIAGHGCVGTADEQGHCRRFCDTAATDCPTGFSCGGLNGFTTVGVCTPDAAP